MRIASCSCSRSNGQGTMGIWRASLSTLVLLLARHALGRVAALDGIYPGRRALDQLNPCPFNCNFGYFPFSGPGVGDKGGGVRGRKEGEVSSSCKKMGRAQGLAGCLWVEGGWHVAFAGRKIPDKNHTHTLRRRWLSKKVFQIMWGVWKNASPNPNHPPGASLECALVGCRAKAQIDICLA